MVAKPGSSPFVLVALLVLASVVSADANALGISAAKIAARESVPAKELRRESDSQGHIEGVDEALSDVAKLKATPPFHAAGIGTSAPNDRALDMHQSQQIIVTLTETVGNLSQQLSRKDQKIEFLEMQIGELKKYIGADVFAEPLVPAERLVLAEPLIPVKQFPSNEFANAPTNAPAVTSFATLKQTIPLWQWALLCFFALSSLVYLMRARLYTLGQWLNLVGAKNQLEFNSVAEQTLSHSDLEVNQELKPQSSNPQSSKSQCSKLRSGEAQSPKPKVQSPPDESMASATDKSLVDQKTHDRISYLGLADDGSYEANDVLDFEARAITEDIEDLSFDQRFEQLLAEKDFAFARELLDFTRYNEINDERYHCKRLCLLEKMGDEDGFYAYYYEIESKIPTFPQNLQTQISQLVVMLAQR